MNNKTGRPLPEFVIELLNGESWQSNDKPSGHMILFVVYRGMWCGHCKHQLQSLERLYDQFAEREVEVVAVSADTESRAREMAVDYGLSKLSIGYEMPISSAREMGVFISKQEKEIEMPLFCEPASFLINKEGNIQAAWIASNAFARTSADDMLAYVDFLAQHSGRAPRGSA